MLCESKGNLESSFELTYQTKRQLTLIGFALRRFASGLDYIIILPSLYFYLQSFNAKFYWLGLVIAADSLVAFFLAPLIEKLSEKWQRIRVLGFLANLIQIAGSMIYALPSHYFMPVAGRLVSGLGQSCSAAMYGEVKRVTSPEERNRVMIFMEGVRLFGVVIGPGMNFFLKDFDLRFGPWVIDHRTAPGFFMAIVWLLVEIVHIFTVYDLSRHPGAYRELPEHDSEEESTLYKTPTVSQPFTTHHEPSPTRDEHKPTSDEDEPKSEDDHTDSSDGEAKPSEEIRVLESEGDLGESTKHSRPASRGRKLQEIPAMNQSICQLLCRRDVIVILICEFLMFFNQTAFETLMLLIGVDKLGFSITVLSGIFIGAGVEMVTVIVVVWSANKALDAKYLLITSLSAALLASFARLAVGFAGNTNRMGCIVMTVLMGFFTIIGTPIASISGKSLLPKLTPPETHSFYQSAFSVSQHLGLIVGPLVASVMYVHLVLFSALTIAVFLVIYLLLLPTMEKIQFPAHGCGTT